MISIKGSICSILSENAPRLDLATAIGQSDTGFSRRCAHRKDRRAEQLHYASKRETVISGDCTLRATPQAYCLGSPIETVTLRLLLGRALLA